MQAKYNGTCSVCGRRFAAGTAIDYDRATRTTRHENCQPFVAPVGAWEISQGEGYGGTAYCVGTVIHNPNIRDAAAPRYLMVLRASEHYYHHDGMSFGVGDESGYVYSATVRPATDEESAELRAADNRVAYTRRTVIEAKAIVKRIRTEGMIPEHGTPMPEGEQVFDSQTIHGSGSMLVLTADGVWLLERHMMDGDDWNANNVAGTYRGWFLADVAAAQRLRELAVRGRGK